MSEELRQFSILRSEALKRIGNSKVLMVGSGKGGVGKSVVSSLLALELASRGIDVGLLDADVHGSSVPAILGVDKVIRVGKEGFRPIEFEGVMVMSLGLITGDEVVPLRGERKSEVIAWLLSMTDWGDLDYLVVDLPPGTGDEVLSTLRLTDGLVRRSLAVSTPSAVAIRVARRYVSLMREEGVDVVGVINMAYNLDGTPSLFGEAGDLGVDKVFRLPIDPGVEEFIRGVRSWRDLSDEMVNGVRAIVDELVSG